MITFWYISFIITYCSQKINSRVKFHCGEVCVREQRHYHIKSEQTAPCLWWYVRHRPPQMRGVLSYSETCSQHPSDQIILLSASPTEISAHTPRYLPPPWVSVLSWHLLLYTFAAAEFCGVILHKFFVAALWVLPARSVWKAQTAVLPPARTPSTVYSAECFLSGIFSPKHSTPAGIRELSARKLQLAVLSTRKRIWCHFAVPW